MKKNRKEVGDLVLLFRDGLVFGNKFVVKKLLNYIKSINKTTTTTTITVAPLSTSPKNLSMEKIISKGGKKCQMLMK